MKVLILIFFLAFFNPIFSQSNIDSLQTTLNSTSSDTTRINILLALAKEYRNEGNYDSSIVSSGRAIQLSQKLQSSNNKSFIEFANRSLPNAYNFLGIAYSETGDFVQAFGNLQTYLRLEQEAQNQKGIAKALNNIGDAYYYKGNYPRGLEYYFKALAIRIRRGDKKGEGSSYQNIGDIYSDQGNYQKAFDYYNRWLTIRQETGDSSGVIKAKNNIGTLYYFQGNFAMALENFYSILHLQQGMNDKQGEAITLNNIGAIYSDQGEFDKGLENYLKALTIYEQLNDQHNIASTQCNIGIVYQKQNRHNKALDYFYRALKTQKELSDQFLMSSTLANIGSVYASMGKETVNKDSVHFYYSKSLSFLNQSVKIQQELSDKRGLATSYITIGKVASEQKKFDEAIQNFNKSLSVSQEIGSQDIQKDALEALSTIYEKTGQGLPALKYYKEFIIARDSIYNLENTKKGLRAEMNFEFEKKEAIAKLEQEKKEQQHAEEVKRQSIVIVSVIIVLLLIIVFTLSLYKRFRIIRKQKEVIEHQKKVVDESYQLLDIQKNIVEEKNKEITDSINYASRIQRALLTSEDYLRNQLNKLGTNKNEDSFFIFYQPKDIVSGDFYYSVDHNNRLYITTADCTGHGVPGAFMSMLNISYLTEKIIEKEISKPNEILNQVRDSVIKALNPNGASDTGAVNDGMDCVLLCFDFDSKVNGEVSLSYAAANNSFYILRDGELITQRPDKMAVGKSPSDHISFTNYEVKLKQGDIIYTLTDGYPDQFGGSQGKKFKYKQLESLLVSFANKPMREQKQMLSDTINKWKDGYEQVDDILLIGVRV